MDIKVGSFDDLASMLGAEPPSAVQIMRMSDNDTEEVDDIFEKFKQFAVGYVQEHDQLPEDHQILGQIENSASIDDIETFLRNGLDYCDECMVAMFKKFVSGPIDPEEDGCGCDGDMPDGEEHTPFPDEVGPGCG